MNAGAETERGRLARRTMEILDGWQLNRDEIVAILALSARTRGRQLDRFRGGEALPDEAPLLTRAEHISGIADALRTSFPRNAGIAARWLSTPHRRFRGRAPLALMLEDGVDGLCRVRAELDCSFSWSRSQEPAA